MCKYCDSLGTVAGPVDGYAIPGTSLACMPAAIDNYTPCQNSPYARLPEGLRKALANANRLQDILFEELRAAGERKPRFVALCGKRGKEEVGALL